MRHAVPASHGLSKVGPNDSKLFSGNEFFLSFIVPFSGIKPYNLEFINMRRKTAFLVLVLHFSRIALLVDTENHKFWIFTGRFFCIGIDFGNRQLIGRDNILLSVNVAANAPDQCA